MLPFEILARKRAGKCLTAEEIGEVVAGATDGSWSDAQLAAFLMAAAIHELEPSETRALTEGMLDSGERWKLDEEIPHLCDKHSTGGVGDKVSLVLAPLVAACGLPVVMLTGRGLGHTGGTADKLEAIPGLVMDFDRAQCLEMLRRLGVAIGVATADIAPADKRLYAIRDQTGTVESLPLITASILSKKLATGASSLVLDVKTGSGAFIPDIVQAERLAKMMVTAANALGCRTSALLTDMSQPLGRWVGHSAEVLEALECLRGEGPEDLEAVTFALSTEVARLEGVDLDQEALKAALSSGDAYEKFMQWALAQGANREWVDRPELTLAPEEFSLVAPRSGFLAAVDTRRLGFLLVEAGGGRAKPGAEIDMGVALRYDVRLGEAIDAGQVLGRLFLRRADDGLGQRFVDCFEIVDQEVSPPPLVGQRIVES
ncbi:MAG: thymidine phosphorylase [Thermoanaerobaculia bacterium]|nr:thymidine phosphorylase [Thermoanaerobaculia bacterium]